MRDKKEERTMIVATRVTENEYDNLRFLANEKWTTISRYVSMLISSHIENEKAKREKKLKR